jgi:pimeloyl-ACP methyl ester carboxylesterase
MYEAKMSVTTNTAYATAKSFTANRWFSALKLGLRSLERMSTPLAARAAAGVFLTPVPTKLAVRHIAPPPQVRIERVPFESASITAYHWPAPADAPTVLLVHGWGGWGLQFAAVAQALSDAGYAAIALDMPGHGRSNGWQSTLPQFARAVHYMAARHAGESGAVHGVVAHSMGAAASAIAVSRGMRVGAFVSVASPTSAVQVTHEYASAFRLSESTREAMVRWIEAREGVVFAQLDAQYTARSTAQLPMLLVHDEADKVVPYVHAQQLQRLNPQAKLLTTQGLGHQRLLKSPEVVQAVLLFIQSRGMITT